MSDTTTWIFGIFASLISTAVVVISLVLAEEGVTNAVPGGIVATQEPAPKALDAMTEAEKKAFDEKLLIEKGVVDARG
ncbi:MAG: hypothetical protein JNK57_14550, partial [Planctomycetaceae bacterium]|nr:hypothetical protein [Planctomycetaceae bacterium]